MTQITKDMSTREIIEKMHETWRQQAPNASTKFLLSVYRDKGVGFDEDFQRIMANELMCRARDGRLSPVPDDIAMWLLSEVIENK